MQAFRAEVTTSHVVRKIIFTAVREHHNDLAVAAEVQIIECPDIGNFHTTTLVFKRYPSGFSAIAAVDYRQIMLCLAFVQIRRKSVGNAFTLCNLGNKTAEFTEPQLNLNRQERTQFVFCSYTGVGNQSQQCIDCGDRIDKFFYLWISGRQLVRYVRCLHIIAVHQHKHILTEAVRHQQLSQSKTSLGRCHILCRSSGQPCLRGCVQIIPLVILIDKLVQRLHLLLGRHGEIRRFISCKELHGRETVLGNDSILFKRLPEYLFCKFTDAIGRIF